MAFFNASVVGSGGTLVPGTSSVSLGELPSGSTLGFFVIADGFNVSPFFGGAAALAGGQLNFRLNGAPVSLASADAPPQLVFTNAEGSEQVIAGTIFHSTALAAGPFGSTLAINPDGLQHFASGLSGGGLAFGYEDLSGGGDSDFNDGLFRIDIEPALVGDPSAPIAFAPSLTIADDGSLLTGATA